MYRVKIRYYEELNDFISRDQRKRDIEYSFPGRRSIKDLIESFGVPHVEVDLILVNGESVDFNYIVQDGDAISVYPVFETLNIKGVTRLRKIPLRNIRFVLDVHLRKLARMLRLLGFDAAYNESSDDSELALISSEEKRVLLTRDRQLLMHRTVDRGLYIRNTDPRLQIIEVLDRLDLRNQCRPFSRCIMCNGKIRKMDFHGADKEKKSRIPPGVRDWCSTYHICSSCEKIYWEGSHYEKLKMFVKKVIDN
ncbi:Mut7-C RNAse domain-containing protein [Spirochaetota bacterium]